MVDKRSKYTASARDKLSSIGGDTSRFIHENFVTEFIKYAEEYNVDPPPRIVRSLMDFHLPSTASTISDKLANCNINAFGVMQIADMVINIGCVVDLNLDMNPNAQENYHLLCAAGGNLKYLSLRLCQISDSGVKRIADELRYRDPPNDPKLIILNLANNHITKDGAACVGKMLRTNRSLRCLVLLGNRICDEGANFILQELKMYCRLPKTNAELIYI